MGGGGIKRFVAEVFLTSIRDSDEDKFIEYVFGKMSKSLSRNSHNIPEEERRYCRYVRRFIARFKLKEDSDLSNWHVPTVKDISIGGCYIFSPASYKVGAILDISIQLPSRNEPICFGGEVRRCKGEETIPKMPRYGLAVSFLELNEKQRNVLAETTEFLQVQDKV